MRKAISSFYRGWFKPTRPQIDRIVSDWIRDARGKKSKREIGDFLLERSVELSINQALDAAGIRKESLRKEVKEQTQQAMSWLVSDLEGTTSGQFIRRARNKVQKSVGLSKAILFTTRFDMLISKLAKKGIDLMEKSQ